jgi:hypothetical protein
MHTARPGFLDLADRPDLRQTAQDWRHRVDIRTARTGHPPADAVLIRPDACIAWAAATGEPTGTAEPARREALSGWFGTPLKRQCPSSTGPPDRTDRERQELVRAFRQRHGEISAQFARSAARPPRSV